jgi:Pretoxin HINT domain
MKSIRPQNHLVHTDNGLVPIEKMHGGNRVLAIQVKAQASQTISTLITTANHPFWVAGEDWLAAVHLQPGHTLQLSDGSQASVYATGLVRRTQHAHIGFAADDATGFGMVLTLSEGQVKPASDAQVQSLGKLELDEPYLTRVYNFEVDEFHTYYVAELGVWVHNTYGGPEAVRTVVTIAEDIAAIKEGQSPACFVAGTLVHTKEGLMPIEQIQIGDWVLSYPDDQQPPPGKFREPHEYTYKRVVQTFVTENQRVTEFPVSNLASGNIERLTATPNHPIYVKDEGWIALELLCARRKLVAVVTNDFSNLTFGGLYKNKGFATVYNIEVEDFHTYYVGEEGLWVHNCDPHSTREITNLKGLLNFVKMGEGKVEIYRVENYLNRNKTNTPAYSGTVGEINMKTGVEAAIQREV